MYSGGLGETDSRKNLKSKISWNCPFKSILQTIIVPASVWREASPVLLVTGLLVLEWYPSSWKENKTWAKKIKSAGFENSDTSRRICYQKINIKARFSLIVYVNRYHQASWHSVYKINLAEHVYRLGNRNNLFRFRFRLRKSFGSGSGSRSRPYFTVFHFYTKSCLFIVKSSIVAQKVVISFFDSLTFLALCRVRI